MGVIAAGILLVGLCLTAAVLVTVGVNALAALRLRRAAVVALLATAVRTGRPLAEEFDALTDTVLRGDRRRAWPVADALKAGASLSQALAAGRGLFAAETVAAARVGEATGRLADALAAESRRIAGRSDATPVVSGAGSALPAVMLYLTVVPLVVGCLTAFLSYYVVPKYLKIMEDFGYDLPPATRWLYDAGDSAVGLLVGGICCAWFLGVAVLLAVASDRPVVPAFLRRRRLRRGGGPLRAAALAVRGGTPPADALRAFAGEERSGRVAAAAARLDDTDGDAASLADALHAAGLTSRDEHDAISTAGPAGTLRWTLDTLADARDGHGRVAGRLLFEFARPAAVALLGGVTLAFALAFFEPLLVILRSLPGVER